MAVSIILNNSINHIIKNSGINDNSALFAANEAKKLMREYVPMKTGNLCDTAQAFVENGRGVIYYPQPYANFCYYCEKKTFRRDKHEKASAYWDKAMAQTHKGELTVSVGNFIKRKGR